MIKKLVLTTLTVPALYLGYCFVRGTIVGYKSQRAGVPVDQEQIRKIARFKA